MTKIIAHTNVDFDVRKFVAAMSAPRELEAGGFSPDTLIVGRQTADQFTHLVAMLKLCPQRRLRLLGFLIWDLIGNRFTPTALYDGVPRIGFTVLPGAPAQGIIVIPSTWLSLAKADTIYGLSSIVYVGSQAVDYWTGRMANPTEWPKAVQRADVYEAEFLHYITQVMPTWKPSELQERLKAQYPQGSETSNLPPDLIYAWPNTFITQDDRR